MSIATTRMWEEASGWSPAEALGSAINIGISHVVSFVALSVGFFYVMYAKLCLGLLLGLGPIFIACALFDSTRRFFDGWLSQCANFIILQILIAAVQAVIVKMLMGIFLLKFGVSNPGAFASAVITCLVMMMVFWQLPNISHALAQGGASLGLQALPGVASVKHAISNHVGDHVARSGDTGRAKLAAGGSATAREVLAAKLLKPGSRGGFADRRHYQHRRSSGGGGSVSPSTDAQSDGGSNAYQQQNSDLKK